MPLDITTLSLIPDYDHNRKIDDKDRQRALKKDPYYFWVNDDDGYGDTEGTGIPASSLYLLNSPKVNGTRDLIDYFPVYLDIAKMKALYSPGSYKYKLHHAPSTLNLVETTLTPDAAGKYLTDVPTAQELAFAKKTPITFILLTLNHIQI
ncbi:MAG: hypothetical protein HY888_13230 [Deltaproteobacteria bacterium]|nr:hypothetical protein [Deltaproteobacteria bacterium]